MVAQKEAVAAALAANERAVEKAEETSEKWRENANEWRGAMSDRERNLMPRIEAEAMHGTLIKTVEQLNETLSEKIQEIRIWAGEGYGKVQGTSQAWGVLSTALPILIAAIAVIIAVMR